MNREPIKRIVVGIDFSRPSLAALDHAIEIANREDAEIVLAHADAAPRSAKLDEQGEPTTKLDEMLLSNVRRQREQLERLADEKRAAGIHISHAVIDNDPVPGVAFAANELDADLVIVGSRGNTGVKRFLLGSVAERTLRLAECRAMVARGAAPSGGYRRVLVPVDFSPAADRALQLGMQLAADGAEVELFHCAMPPGLVTAATPEGAVSQPMAAIMNDLEETAAARLDDLVRRHRTSRVQLHSNISLTVAPAGILDRFDDDDDPRFDLAVMGTRGRTGWRRFFLGSNAESVARHAPCSVVAVHDDSEDESD